MHGFSGGPHSIVLDWAACAKGWRENGFPSYMAAFASCSGHPLPPQTQPPQIPQPPAPPIPIPTPQPQNPCNQKILDRFNDQLHVDIPLITSGPTATVTEVGDRGGSWNIRVTVPAGTLSVGSITGGKRYPSDALGVGSTLHIVRSSVTYAAGAPFDNVQVHLDQGDPDLLHPLGAISHLDYVIFHAAGSWP